MDAATSLSTDGEGSAKKGLLSAAAAQGAVTFGLGLFHAHLKRGTFAHLELANGSNGALRAMADPFVGLLSVAIKSSGDNQVVLASLKCLGFLLKWQLPSIKKFGPGVVSWIHGVVLLIYHTLLLHSLTTQPTPSPLTTPPPPLTITPPSTPPLLRARLFSRS